MPNQHRLRLGADATPTRRTRIRLDAEREAYRRDRCHTKAAMYSFRSAELSRIYWPGEYTFLKAKGWLLDRGYQVSQSRCASVISNVTGVLAGYSVGCFVMGFTIPSLAVGSIVKATLTLSIAGLCVLIGRRSANQCLTQLHNYCGCSSVAFFGRLLERNPYFHMFYREKSSAVFNEFFRNLYGGGNVNKALDFLSIELFQHLITEYLEEAFEHYPELRSMGGYEQFNAIKDLMKSDREYYTEVESQTSSDTQSSYGLLLNLTACLLCEVHDTETVLAVTEKTLGELTKNNKRAGDLYNAFLVMLPHISKDSLMRALYLKLIDSSQNHMPENDKWRGTEAHPFVFAVLHKAIKKHFREKLDETEQKAEVCVSQERTPESSDSEKSDHPSSTIRKAKRKKFVTKPHSKHIKSEAVPENFHLNMEIGEAVVEQSDCQERKIRIRKCLERIQDCKHWGDIRVVSSKGKGWVAEDKGTGISMPVYHMSAGMKEKGDTHTATVLYTRSGNEVEPIAIAAHTGRHASEYRIIQPLGGWQIPQKTVDLREAFVATKAPQPAHLLV